MPTSASLWVRGPQDSVLDAGRRWRLFARRTFFSRQAAARLVMPSVLGQVRNDPELWGRTPIGLSRRVGGTVASVTGRELLLNASAAAFAVDPRYAVCACDGARHRLGHALSGVVMFSAGDAGRRPAPLHLVAALGSGALDAALSGGVVTAQQVGQRALTRVASVAVANVVLEFRPELRRTVRRVFRRGRDADDGPAVDR